MNDNAKIALGLAAIYCLCKGELPSLPIFNYLPSSNVYEDKNDEYKNDE